MVKRETSAVVCPGSHLGTATGARPVSSRSGDGSQRAVDRSETIGTSGHAAEWDTPRSVGNGTPVNSLVAVSTKLDECHLEDARWFVPDAQFIGSPPATAFCRPTGCIARRLRSV